MSFPDISNSPGVTLRHDGAVSTGGPPSLTGSFPGMGSIKLSLNPLATLSRGIQDLLAGRGNSVPPSGPTRPVNGQLPKNAIGYTDRKPSESCLKVLLSKL